MKHKDHYNDSYIQRLSQDLSAALPGFDAQGFTGSLLGRLEDKELFARLDCIVDALQQSMPGEYEANLQALYGLLGPQLAGSEGMFSSGWWLWPIGRYVERNGTQSWQASLAFLKELTKRFTGEYAIRPLLKAYPRQVMDELVLWTADENVHVRRLAAEGVRIRLPWSEKLLVALEEFELYTEILTRLKDDPERFVQKSVGNNLNDLYRQAPDKAQQLVALWQATPGSPAQDWVIRHGTRSLRPKQKKP